MLSLEEYVKNYKIEDVTLPKFTTYNPRWEKKVWPELHESSYYKQYLIHQKTHQLKESDFCLILERETGTNLYTYAQTYPFIYFCVKHSIFLVNKKLKRSENKYALTELGELQLTCHIYRLLIDTSEVDVFGRTSFCKKRVYNRIITTLEEHEVLNLNFIKLVLKEEMVNNKTLQRIIQISLLQLEQMLTELGIVRNTIDYGAFFGCKQSIKTTVALELNSINTLQEILNSENYVDSLTHDEISTITQEVVETQKQIKKFTDHGTRLMLLSKQIQLIKDVQSIISFKTPVISLKHIIHNKVAYPKLIHNQLNPAEYTKCFIDTSLAVYMSISPIIFDSNLFKISQNLFTIKYSEITQKWDKVRIMSIWEFLMKGGDSKGRIPLYFPHSLDFRGRVYTQTEFSITSIKLLRQLIYTEETIVPFDENNKFVKQFLNQVDILNGKPEFEGLRTNTEKIVVLIGLLNLGKHRKSFLQKKGSVNCGVTLKEFLEDGIVIYRTKNSELVNTLNIVDIDDLGGVVTMKAKLQTYLHIRKPFTVLVDSTASGIFHLNHWLNLKSEYLKYINLSDEDVWYDTYNFLLTKTVQYLKENQEKIKIELEKKENRKAKLTSGKKEKVTNYEDFAKQLNILDIDSTDKESVTEAINRLKVSRNTFQESLKSLTTEIKEIQREKKKTTVIQKKETKLQAQKKKFELKAKIEYCNALINTFNKILFKLYKPELTVANLGDIIDKYSYLFTRSRIKKIYMTLPYNATEYTLYNYFCENMSLEDISITRHLIFSPFIYSVRQLFNELHKKSLSSILNHSLLDNKNNAITLAGNTYDLNYYNRESVDTEKVINKERYYFTEYKIKTTVVDGVETPQLNSKKVKTALTANIMHMTDALFLRNVYLQCRNTGTNINTIHDEFIIPVGIYFKFLEYQNKAYSDLYFEINGVRLNIQSLFIAL